jgi:hypothetical protein
VTAFVALLAAGCGGSGNDDSATAASSSSEVTVETGSLSKAQFVKQARAICTKSHENFERDAVQILKRQNADPTKASKGDPEAELVLDAFVPNFQSQIDQVSELGAPRGDEEKVSAFLTALQEAVDGASNDPRAFVRSEADLGKAPKLAKAYGLEECASLSF